MKPYYQDGSCTIYHGDCREVTWILWRYGLQIGRWHVTWYDLWARQWCFEISREVYR